MAKVTTGLFPSSGPHVRRLRASPHRLTGIDPRPISRAVNGAIGDFGPCFNQGSPVTKRGRSSCYNSLPAAGKAGSAIPLPWRKMAAPDVVWKNGRFGQTSRPDAWWLSPSAVLIGLSAFLVYSSWAALQNSHYTFGPYISPFYSPEIFGDSPHALFGPKPAGIRAFCHFLPLFSYSGYLAFFA